MSTRTTTIIVLIMIAGATLAGLLLWNRFTGPHGFSLGSERRSQWLCD
jgi:hypothetical protein